VLIEVTHLTVDEFIDIVALHIDVLNDALVQPAPIPDTACHRG
jgi:hypothetical protein